MRVLRRVTIGEYRRKERFKSKLARRVLRKSEPEVTQGLSGVIAFATWFCLIMVWNQENYYIRCWWKHVVLKHCSESRMRLSSILCAALSSLSMKHPKFCATDRLRSTMKQDVSIDLC